MTSLIWLLLRLKAHVLFGVVVASGPTLTDSIGSPKDFLIFFWLWLMTLVAEEPVIIGLFLKHSPPPHIKMCLRLLVWKTPAFCNRIWDHGQNGRG